MKMRMWTILVAASLAACGTEAIGEDPFAPEEGEDVTLTDDETPLPPPVQSTLWGTCGDPVCSGWVNKGLPRCGSHQVGDPCPASAIGRECDPGDFCNTTLRCDTEDPTLGGCPISKAEHKRDIAYVGTDQRAELASELLQMKLATYRYKKDGATGPEHLGFIIDDVGASPAVLPSGERVDLYGYTSMTVATVQLQAERIATLEARLAALEARLAE
jgi:hypothetical protein